VTFQIEPGWSEYSLIPFVLVAFATGAVVTGAEVALGAEVVTGAAVVTGIAVVTGAAVVAGTDVVAGADVTDDAIAGKVAAGTLATLAGALWLRLV
jgi:hypothetical protein